jgi:signal transduction histidine kinase
VQLLFSQPEEEQILRAVDAAAALQPVVTGACAQGQHVRADIPAGVCVWSTDQGLAQVVSILRDNAAQHAGSPVELRVTSRSDGVVLRCEDRGWLWMRSVTLTGASSNAARSPLASSQS